ncbi:MAG: hypothetical protein AAF518_01750 [Spirochaetota bacterium]
MRIGNSLTTLSNVYVKPLFKYSSAEQMKPVPQQAQPQFKHNVVQEVKKMFQTTSNMFGNYFRRGTILDIIA